MPGLILVPVDPDGSSDGVLPVAAQIATQDDARLMLLAVGELPETSEHERDERTALEGRLAHARNVIGDAAAETRVELGGDPVSTIVQVAEEVGASKIVLAHDPRWRELGERSVAYQVAHDTLLPVLVYSTRNSSDK